MDAALEEAAWAGDAAEVARLLGKGADVHANEEAALRVACAEGHTRVVELLLTAGADVHAQHEGALCAACEGGHDAVVERLLAAGADPSPTEREFDAPLDHASSGGHLPVVELLLARGVDVHADDDAALVRASMGGHLAVVDRLVVAGADVHSRAEDPLREACRCGHADVVARLIRAGANVRLSGPESPLWWASWTGRLDIVDLLLAASVDVAAAHSFALVAAVRAGHRPVVDRLVAVAVDPLVSLRTQFAWQADEGWGCIPVLNCLLGKDPTTYANPDDAFLYASAVGDVGAVGGALLAGASVHADDGLAIRLACWAGQLPVVERLLAAGADVHACYDNALEQACGSGHIDVVDALLAAGANVHAACALRWACANGHLDVMERMLRAGADVHLHGEAALTAAADAGHLQVVSALLAMGADASQVPFFVMSSDVSVVKLMVDAGFQYCASLLNLAVSRGHLDVVDVLLHAGVKGANEVDMLVAVKKGHIDVVERIFKAGYQGSVQFWRDVRKAGLAPSLVLAVPRASFAALPPPVQPLWLRYKVRIRQRLVRALQRARDRLDRPPQGEPLGAGAPTRERLIAHLKTAGRRFAREYWTEGIPIFWKGAAPGPVPDEFAAPCLDASLRAPATGDPGHQVS